LITAPSVEISIAPSLDKRAGIGFAEIIFERRLFGDRILNPENADDYISTVCEEG
jgi:hypothetical protein